jgi:hypothetical protein
VVVGAPTPEAGRVPGAEPEPWLSSPDDPRHQFQSVGGCCASVLGKFGAWRSTVQRAERGQRPGARVYTGAVGARVRAVARNARAAVNQAVFAQDALWRAGLVGFGRGGQR